MTLNHALTELDAERRIQAHRAMRWEVRCNSLRRALIYAAAYSSVVTVALVVILVSR